MILTVAVGVLLAPAFASAAHLYISEPAGVVCEGKTYMVDIRLDSPDEYINTIQLELDWDPARMQMVDTNFSGSLFFFWPFASVDNVAGYAKSIGGIMTPGYRGTGGLVYRPVIQALGTGSVTLTILPTTDVLLNDGYGTSTSVTFDHLTLSVIPATDPACLPPPTPTPGPTSTPGPPGTPGPTPTPFECPDVPSCSLPDEGDVYPCDFITSCPGQPQVIVSGFVTDPDVQCPMQIACEGIGALVPTVTPVEPGTTQQEALTIVSQVVGAPAATSIVQTLYELRPVLGLVAALGIAGGIAAIIAGVVQLAGIAGGLSAFGPLLWYQLLGLTHLRRRRARCSGVVYDSATKRPIPLATVQLLRADGRILEKRVTDTEGRFDFLLSEEPSSGAGFTVRVSKQGYRFPSTAPVGSEAEFYPNIYRGGDIVISRDKLLNVDIPLDPEMPQAVTPQRPARPAPVVWLSALGTASYRISLVTAPLNFLLMPNLFNGVMVGIVALVGILRALGYTVRPFGVIMNSADGMAVPSAFVALSVCGRQRTGCTVSDARGRFFLRSLGGLHELAVNPAVPTTLPSGRTTRVITTPDGWMRRTITL